MKWQKGPSEIHGDGAIATEPIAENESVGSLITGLKAGGLLGGDRTDLGRALNHQSRPNGRMEPIPGTGDQYHLRSLSKIRPGSEITMDYNDSPPFVATPRQIDPENYKNWG